jgi:hypothetical protein
MRGSAVSAAHQFLLIGPDMAWGPDFLHFWYRGSLIF